MNNIAWGTNFNHPDMIDQFVYLANLTTVGSEFYWSEASTGCESTTPLREENILVKVLNWDLVPPATVDRWYRQLFLDSAASVQPGSGELWVGKQEPHTDPTCPSITNRIHATRLGSIEPGTLADSPWDFLRMMYRMNKAANVDDAVFNALGGAQSLYPLGLLMGSDFDPTPEPPTQGPQPTGPQPTGPESEGQSTPRLLYIAASRVPYRPNDTALTPSWFTFTNMSGTLGTYKWTTNIYDKMFHPIQDFPIIRAHELAGPPENRQFLPWFLDLVAYFTWINSKPAPIVGSCIHDYIPIDLGQTVGGMTLRQEWVIRKLKEKYENNQPYSISEDELRDLITDIQDDYSYYMRGLIQEGSGQDWFQNLAAQYAPGGPSPDPQKYALVNEFRDWAPGGQVDVPPQTAGRWHIFLYYFLDQGSPINPNPPTHAPLSGQLFKHPFYQSFRFATGHNSEEVVRTAADAALTSTLDAIARHADLSLGNLLQAHVPFTTDNYPVKAARESLKTAWPGGWISPLEGSSPPKRDVPGGSRVPMLIRLRNSGSTQHDVWIMNLGMVADDSDGATYSEWTGEAGAARYRESIKRWAENRLTVFPMTEQSLGEVPVYAPAYNSNRDCTP